LCGHIAINDTSSQVHFDTDTTVWGEMAGTFLIKYSTAGVFQWFRMPMRDTVNFLNNKSQFLSLPVTPDGHLYAYAYLEPGSYGNGDFVITSGGYYVVTYDASGNYQQLTQLNMQSTYPPGIGWGSSTLLHLNRDRESGKYYIGGQYTTNLGTLSYGNIAIVSNLNMFGGIMVLAAFDSLGNNLWVKQGSPDTTSSIECAPAIDGDGNIYIGGFSYPGNIFNGDTTTNSMGIHSVPFVMSGIHVSKIESLTYTNNTIAATGVYEDSLQWSAVNRHTNYLGDAFLVRINAATGNLIGLDTLHAANGSDAWAITSDKNSNFYVGGFFRNQLYFNGSTITALDAAYDWFVAKFGTPNTCSCNLPQPNYTHTHTGNTYNFTYSGTTPYLSIDWDFGDGTTASNVTMPVHNYPSVGNYPVCVTVSDGCGSNTACHTISIVTGINELATLSGIQIYPNPATEYLTITNATSGTAMDVYNITGSRLVHTVLNQEESTVDMRGFAAGLYLIRFTNAGGAAEDIKFMKQ